MTFTTHNDTPIQTCGTSYAGTITATLPELRAAFGEPEDGSPGQTRAEWAIRFGDGTIATIYDWKRREPVTDVTEWNIGGFHMRAVGHVRAALESARAELARIRDRAELARFATYETQPDGTDPRPFPFPIRVY